MLQEVRDLQNRAVNDLISQIAVKDEITFEAPTGSGKTYMMADFMDKILSNNEDVVFLVSALSKSGLAKQNFDKFYEYSENGDFSNLKPYLISSETSEEGSVFIPTDYNVYVLPRDLYKAKGKLMQGGLDGFLSKLTLNKDFGGNGKTIYLIKDECHEATKNIDNLLDKYFNKKINISATPNYKRGQRPDVIITEDEAVNAKLIKWVEYGEDNEDMSFAIDKFEEIKKNYRDLLGVNPCLIIQVSNKNKIDEEFQKIFAILNTAEHQDLHWMYIVENKKDCRTNDEIAQKTNKKLWKDLAKDKLSTIDIILFKMVITEGWDIPRACMLYQVRDSQSQQLDRQVIGRVRRNPRLLDFEILSEDAQKLAMTSWIWGIVPKQYKSFAVKLCADGYEIQQEIKLKTTRLKTLEDEQDFTVENFLKSKQNNVTHQDIFKLYKNLHRSNNTIQDKCYHYADSYEKWYKFVENIDEITRESSRYICNYSQSMEITKNEDGSENEVSFAPFSSYLDNKNYTNINDWVWKRKDGQDKFSFDSEAEREWASILQNLASKNNAVLKNKRAIKSIFVGKQNQRAGQINYMGEVEPKYLDAKEKYLWGKNYLQNSEIKYQYYLEGLHFSYPDFIMKDSFDRIHLFEVKSVNPSSSIKIDTEEYENKIRELENCYKQASKLTGYIFYLPILKNEEWQITIMENGEKNQITKDEFIKFVIGENNLSLQEI